MTGAIAHHAATSRIFPPPAPGSQPRRTPLPWGASKPFRGLGFREIETADRAGRFDFVRDVFCGDGHEGMARRIVVA